MKTRMKLRSKLILGSFSMLILVMVASTIAVYLVTNKQNSAAVYRDLQRALTIVQDDLSSKQQKLLTDSRQIATVEQMGSKIKFLYEYKENEDESMTSGSYTQISTTLAQIARAGDLSKVAIYDLDGALTAFSDRTGGEKELLGFCRYAPSRTIHYAVPGQDGQVQADAWQKTDALAQSSIATSFGDRIPLEESLGFEKMDGFICLVSYAPIIGDNYNDATGALEKKQFGFVMAVQRLKADFAQGMSRLTGTGINLFLDKALCAGAVPEYSTLQANEGFDKAGSDRSLQKQPILLGSVALSKESYFQAVLPIFNATEYIGAIASLGSKDAVRANTWQMVRLLGLVYLGCLLLILPFVLLFSGSLARPILRVIQALSDTAQRVSDASSQISLSSQQAADGASEQAASLEETSSSLEEMASMTRQNADHAHQADSLSKEGSENLKKANVSMKALIDSMDDTTKASGNVAKIIKTIDEIAFQTNLLALNAAVEAARAGDAGAGFAVVADEVRNLALRSAEASRNTQKLVEEIIQKIEKGSDLVKETDQRYREAALSVQKVTELIGEISSASKEQSQGIDEVNRVVAEMDRVTQQNAASAEQSASAAVNLKSQAAEMEGVVSDLGALVLGASSVRGTGDHEEAGTGPDAGGDFDSFDDSDREE
ncbi:MAG: hypothetical protein JW821_01895 [Deltaproteobacteria bacterium]|nr:hypothetical protein [Deltaproteobacteria bacterium]